MLQLFLFQQLLAKFRHTENIFTSYKMLLYLCLQTLFISFSWQKQKKHNSSKKHKIFLVLFVNILLVMFSQSYVPEIRYAAAWKNFVFQVLTNCSDCVYFNKNLLATCRLYELFNNSYFFGKIKNIKYYKKKPGRAESIKNGTLQTLAKQRKYYKNFYIFFQNLFTFKTARWQVKNCHYCQGVFGS